MEWSDVPAASLLHACAQQDAIGAWQEFIRRYHDVLSAAAQRVSGQRGRGSADEIDDVTQEIYLRICSNRRQILSGFRDSRPEAIYGYLKVVATNIAHDYFRRWQTKQNGGDVKTISTEELLDDPVSQKETAAAMERRLALKQIDEALIANTKKDSGPRDRTVFRLYYHQGMTARAIAGLPGIGLSSKGVEGVLQRLTRSIRGDFGETQEMGAD